MVGARGPRSRGRWLAWASAALVLILAGGGAWVLWQRQQNGQAMRIEGADVATPGTASAATTPTATRRPARPGEPPFATSVSANGRYLLDQFGRPFLVRGDSPWALMTKLSPEQAERWFADREQQGFNAAIVSLIGATANGGPKDDGSTYDGLRPFADGDVLRWQEPYWERVTSYLRLAADHGITVMLYPIDGWTVGKAFVPASVEQCRGYGTRLAERFRDLPNIVWMSGGDYFPATDDLTRGSDVDHCIDAMLRGIREAGDGRPFSIQLGYDKSISTENPFWAPRVNWNFVYTYYPTYRAVLEAYARQSAIPAIMAEANYEGENNQPKTADTTDETLRRQVLWSLTSGAAGEFVGSDDWEFHPGWEQRLPTPAVTQIKRLRDTFAAVRWWELVPDSQNRLVTGGRGTQVTDDKPRDVLDSDYVTAARTADGRLAVAYVPTQRTISIDPSVLADGATAAWIDPVSGDRRQVPLTGDLATPGTNSGGTGDWLLMITA